MTLYLALLKIVKNIIVYRGYFKNFDFNFSLSLSFSLNYYLKK